MPHLRLMKLLLNQRTIEPNVGIVKVPDPRREHCRQEPKLGEKLQIPGMLAKFCISFVLKNGNYNPLSVSLLLKVPPKEGGDIRRGDLLGPRVGELRQALALPRGRDCRCLRVGRNFSRSSV